MRHLAMTGMETASWISRIFATGDIRATPPSRRMSDGTRSSAMTAAAPASSATFACSALTTSMMTPPLSISARPTLTRKASDVNGVREDEAAGSWALLSALSDLDEALPRRRVARRGRPALALSDERPAPARRRARGPSRGRRPSSRATEMRRAGTSARSGAKSRAGRDEDPLVARRLGERAPGDPGRQLDPEDPAAERALAARPDREALPRTVVVGEGEPRPQPRLASGGGAGRSRRATRKRLSAAWRTGARSARRSA